MKILSFDVGGSKIAWALIDENGVILNEVKTIPTPKDATEIADFFQILLRHFREKWY